MHALPHSPLKRYIPIVLSSASHAIEEILSSYRANPCEMSYEDFPDINFILFHFWTRSTEKGISVWEGCTLVWFPTEMSCMSLDVKGKFQSATLHGKLIGKFAIALQVIIIFAKFTNIYNPYPPSIHSSLTRAIIPIKVSRLTPPSHIHGKYTMREWKYPSFGHLRCR